MWWRVGEGVGDGEGVGSEICLVGREYGFACWKEVRFNLRELGAMAMFCVCGGVLALDG